MDRLILDPDLPIKDRTQTIDGAVLGQPGPKRGWTIKAAVFRPDRSVVEEAVCWHSQNARATLPRGFPRPPKIVDLPGRWLFGGALYAHFGHFLCESTARLWAFDHSNTGFDGVLFFSMSGPDSEKEAQNMESLFALMGRRFPYKCIEEPTRVQQLVVPHQGMGAQQHMFGTPEYRAFAEKHFSGSPEPTGLSKLYISRSNYKKDRGSLLAEKKLEAALECEGYTVFFPEHHSFTEQARHYYHASHIIGPDGSAFHLVALAGGRDKRIGVLQRRPGSESRMITKHLQYFGYRKATEVRAINCGWSPGGIRRAGLTLFGEARFSELHGQLHAAGLIEDPTPWPDLTEEEIQQDLTDIGEALDADMYEVSAPGNSLSGFPKRQHTDRITITRRA